MTELIRLVRSFGREKISFKKKDHQSTSLAFSNVTLAYFFSCARATLGLSYNYISVEVVLYSDVVFNIWCMDLLL